MKPMCRVCGILLFAGVIAVAQQQTQQQQQQPQQQQGQGVPQMQPPPQGRGMGMGMGRGQMGGRGMGNADVPPPMRANRPPMERGLPPTKWWNNPAMVERLNLNSDQQKKMDDIFQQNRLRLIDLNATLQKEEITLEPLMASEAPDETKALAQIDRVAQARAELEKANARFLFGIRRVLTGDQWKKLQETTRPGIGQGQGMGRGQGMGQGQGPGPGQGQGPGLGNPPGPGRKGR